jgi:long-subunit fatty acid transport protein
MAVCRAAVHVRAAVAVRAEEHSALQDALTTTTQTPEAQLDLELRTFMDTWQVRATPGYTYTLWMFMLLGVIWDATCCRKAAPLTLPRAVRWAAAGETRY